MNQTTQPQTADEVGGVQTNFYLYDRHMAVVGQVAKRIGTRSQSQAMRYIIEDWMRTSGYNEWSKKEQPA